MARGWENGIEMTAYTVNTIAPILNKVDAMNIAYSWIQANNGSDLLINMLPETLCVAGDILHIPTHVFCSRTIWENELNSQLAYLSGRAESWVSGSLYTTSSNATTVKQKFCTIIGTKANVLSFLGLEVIA